MMKPVAWMWDDEYGTCSSLSKPGPQTKSEPLVRLSDAEARIKALEADVQGYRDNNDELATAWASERDRAEAAEALLKEIVAAVDIVLSNVKRVDMHGNGALNDIVWPWCIDQLRAARAIHDKIGVKDE